MPKNYYHIEGYEARRSIGYLLRHAGKVITSRIESLFAEADVSFVQWVILMNLRDGLLTTAAELSQHLCHDSGALTRILDQMEERNFITRNRSKHDRRVVMLQLTDFGLETTEMFLPRVVELYNYLLADFTKSEADQLITLLTRFISKMDAPMPAGEH